LKYRKRPVVIDAWPIADLLKTMRTDRAGLPEKVRAALDAGKLLPLANGLSISTLEGVMVGTVYHVLIQGVAGEFYPCAADIFARTYEGAEP
jgi:hypothetical protein